VWNTRRKVRHSLRQLEKSHFYNFPGTSAMSQNLEFTNYIDAACGLHDLPLNADQRQRVIATFAATAALVKPLLDFELPPETEPASVYRA
jgi:hypothetical protein